MPRDSDKNNNSPRGRRDRPGAGPAGGKGRSGAARGPEKKFAKRGFAGKSEDGERKPYAGKRSDDRPPRRDRDGEAPRPRFNRDDRAGGEKRPYTPRGERGDARPAARSSDRKFGDRKPYAPRDGDREKRPYTPRGEGRDRPTGDRPERKFGGDKKFSRGAPDRGPRKDFGDRGPRKDFGDRPQRGESKPWQKREDGDRPVAAAARRGAEL